MKKRAICSASPSRGMASAVVACILLPLANGAFVTRRPMHLLWQSRSKAASCGNRAIDVEPHSRRIHGELSWQGARMDRRRSCSHDDGRRGLAMSSPGPSSAASSSAEGVGQATDLPDSLDDAADIAARSCAAFATQSGPLSRCRVDFDTSAGDETYTLLKSSTEFMQKFTSGLSYALVPGLMEYKQKQMMRVSSARAELRELMSESERDLADDEKGDFSEGGEAQNILEEKKDTDADTGRKAELTKIVASGGVQEPWKGEVVRIYFPDEGSAALARRDWKLGSFDALVPACVEFSSLGGIQTADTSRDTVILFFCPRASEAKYAEDVLYKNEEREDGTPLRLSVFVNPLLVDMGVTGFGTAGRMLRERLIDGLSNTYYLRTLAWGALTRAWPRDFTVWQEDEGADGGYRMIKRMDRLPSNPEVEDIYDIENGLQTENKDGFGLLNALGDFVNGMTKL